MSRGSVFNDALTAGMQQYAQRQGLPWELRWSLSHVVEPDGSVHTQVSGHVGAEYADDQVPGALRAWAEHLGLSEDVDPLLGSASFSGESRGVVVELWGVVDREQWEQG